MLLYNLFKRNEINLNFSPRLPILIILVYLFTNIILNEFKLLTGIWTHIYPQLFFCLSIMAAIFVRKIKIQDLGFCWANLTQNVFLGLLASLVPYVFIILLYFFDPFQNLASAKINYSLTNLAILLIIAPIVEEVFFRGMLFGSLKKEFNLFWAILLSSFIFMIIHLKIHIGALILGIGCAYLFYLTNSVIPGIILHSLCNLLGVLIVKYLPEIIRFIRVFSGS